MRPSNDLMVLHDHALRSGTEEEVEVKDTWRATEDDACPAQLGVFWLARPPSKHLPGTYRDGLAEQTTLDGAGLV
jgi:hypothetical protein